MKKIAMTLLLGLMGALFIFSSAPVAADAPQQKGAEATKSEPAPADRAKGEASKKAKHQKGEAHKAEHKAEQRKGEATEKAEHAKGETHKAEAAKRLSPQEREDQLHERTMKKYQVKREKAQAANNEKLMASIDKQISKENTRYEKRVKQLAAKSRPQATPTKADAPKKAPEAATK